MKPILANSVNMNSVEKKYSETLFYRKVAGDIIDYMWEPFKLVLVHGVKGARNEMSYKPDFLVVTPERFELHEVKIAWKKGDKLVTGWQEDAKLKVKMAAEKFPWFKFVCVTLKGKKWVYQEF